MGQQSDNINKVRELKKTKNKTKHNTKLKGTVRYIDQNFLSLFPPFLVSFFSFLSTSVS